MTNVEQRGFDSPLVREQLNVIHGMLLTIHKVLLEHERLGYERTYGPIPSAGHFLQLVINDAWFAWLRTLSGLITEIDAFVSEKDPPASGLGEALLAQAQAMLAPREYGNEFQRKYYRVLQESPEAATVHGQWKLSLRQMDV